jgi:hypothetical protein
VSYLPAALDFVSADAIPLTLLSNPWMIENVKYLRDYAICPFG